MGNGRFRKISTDQMNTAGFTIRAAGIHYSIEWAEPNTMEVGGSLGRVQQSCQRIVLTKGQTLASARSTLLHELLHRELPDVDEGLILRLEAVLFSSITDPVNAKAWEFITGVKP